MKPFTPRLVCLQLRNALIAGFGFVLSVSLVVAQTSTELSTGIVERSEDFAVYQSVIAVTDAGGAQTLKTNQFTLLENCLNYYENGQWKESEDVIEPSPNGAVARRGPNKAIFSPDLHSPAVFDIQISDGKRLSGGVRSIQLTDVATGRSVVLATVKASAPGELVPPNRIVYRDAFDGLQADVILVWKHNAFSQWSELLGQRLTRAQAVARAGRWEAICRGIGWMGRCAASTASVAGGAGSTRNHRSAGEAH